MWTYPKRCGDGFGSYKSCQLRYSRLWLEVKHRVYVHNFYFAFLCTLLLHVFQLCTQFTFLYNSSVYSFGFISFVYLFRFWIITSSCFSYNLFTYVLDLFHLFICLGSGPCRHSSIRAWSSRGKSKTSQCQGQLHLGTSGACCHCEGRWVIESFIRRVHAKQILHFA